MVDSVQSKPIADRSVAGVTRVATPVPVATAADQPRTMPSEPSPASLARALSSEAPIDQDRVARIKQAIATGTFPILPATIADRLLALKLEWRSHDAA